jgi:hypothetical protein
MLQRNKTIRDARGNLLHPTKDIAMFKTVFVAAAATLAMAPAVAQASDARQFSHEGVNYTYTSSQKGDVTLITGHSSAGEPFRLYVKGERVTGTYNNRSVNFTTTDVVEEVTKN